MFKEKISVKKLNIGFAVSVIIAAVFLGMFSLVATGCTLKVKKTVCPVRSAEKVDNSEKKSQKPKKEPVRNVLSDRLSIKDKINAPTNKSEMIKAALASKTKKDPFIDTIGRAVSDESVFDEKSSYDENSKLPMPPDSNEKLTKIDLPDFNNTLSDFNNTKTEKPSPNVNYEPVILKGFIGSRAIVSINNKIVTMSLNQEQEGVKAVEINPDSLSAKFIKNGQIMTKTIKTVSNDNYKIISNAN